MEYTINTSKEVNIAKSIHLNLNVSTLGRAGAVKISVDNNTITAFIQDHAGINRGSACLSIDALASFLMRNQLTNEQIYARHLLATGIQSDNISDLADAYDKMRAIGDNDTAEKLKAAILSAIDRACERQPDSPAVTRAKEIIASGTYTIAEIATLIPQLKKEGRRDIIVMLYSLIVNGPTVGADAIKLMAKHIIDLGLLHDHDAIRNLNAAIDKHGDDSIRSVVRQMMVDSLKL